MSANDINSDVHKAILRAVCDPGSIVPREQDAGGLESLSNWQTRAVEEFAAPYIAAAERHRIRDLATEVDAMYNAPHASGPDFGVTEILTSFADLLGDRE